MEIENFNRDMISSVRISKVVDYLTKENPSVIPFNYKFPIVKNLDYKSFSNVVLGFELYSDLPKFIKTKVEVAEKLKRLDLSFKTYLNIIGITEVEFKMKNPKTKLDMMYDWMFENKLDIGILDL